jgi:hypothetical protein
MVRSFLSLRRALDARRDLGPLHQLASDDDLLDLGRALVDAKRPDLAIELLDLDALGHAEPAEDLHRLVDDLLRGLGRVHLRHGGLARDPRRAAVLRPGGAVDEESGGIDRGRHVRESGLRELQVA